MTSAISGTLGLYPPTVQPVEQPLSFLPYLLRLARNPLMTLPRAAYEEPLTFQRLGKRVMVFVADPALVEEVLLGQAAVFGKTPLDKRIFARTLRDGVLTSEGKLWRWQRRTMAPMFRASDILAYAPVMAEAAERQIASWRRDPPGSIQRIDQAMNDTTFDIIARTMLAGELSAEAGIIKRETGYSLSKLPWEIAFSVLNMPRWLPHPATFALWRSARRQRNAVATIIVRRKTAGGSHDDLLDKLLAARDPETQQPMDLDQQINNLLTLLQAGHDTTSRALAWTLYLLARAPDWQERLRAEVNAVTGDAPVTAAHLPSLPLTQQVLKEAMRLYPPAPYMSRIATQPTTLGGIAIPEGAIMMLSVYAIHRHRKLWSDPDRFDPTRFTPEREAGYPRCQFMPFGGGPRICLGAAFAMAEATVVLAALLRGARFDWDGRHEPEPVSRVTLHPTGGMPLRVTPLA